MVFCAGEVTEITQSDLSPHRKLCRTQLADDSQVGTWTRETSGGDEKEVEVPSTEEQRVADLDGNSHQNFDGKNEKSLQEKENDATSKVRKQQRLHKATIITLRIEHFCSYVIITQRKRKNHPRTSSVVASRLAESSSLKL